MLLLDSKAFQEEMAKNADSVRAVRDAVEEVDAAGTEGGLTGFLGRSSAALDTVNGKLANISKSALQFGRQTAVVSAGAAALIYESVKEHAAVEADYIQLQTQAHLKYASERVQLEKDAKGMSKYGVDPKEVVEAYYPLQSVLHNTKQDYEGLKAAAEGAAVGHDTLLNATNAVTSGFKLGFKDVHGFKEEMALLDETVGAGKMHLPDLTETFSGKLWATSVALGLPEREILATVAAATATMGEGGGIKFSNTLSTMLLKAIGLKGEAKSAATKLGLTEFEAADELRETGGMHKLLSQLAAARGRLGQDEWQKDVSEMFGGSRSAGTLFQAFNQMKAQQEIETRLDGVSGGKTLDKHFGEASKALSFDMKQLKSQTHEALNELGKFFGPPVIKGLKDLAGFVQEVAGTFSELPKPIKDGLGVLVVFTAALAPVAFVVAGLARVFMMVIWPIEKFIWLVRFVPTILETLDGAAWGLAAALEGVSFAAVTAGLASVVAFTAPILALVAAWKALDKLLPQGDRPENLLGGNQPGEKHQKANEEKVVKRFNEEGAHAEPHINGVYGRQIELILHTKVDLDGKQVALGIVHPLHQIERREQNLR